MPTNAAERRQYFSWNHTGRITLQAVIPSALLITGIIMLEQFEYALTLETIWRELKAAFVLILGMFSFCFPFILVARYAALHFRLPMRWQTYLAVLMSLYAPLASFVAYQILTDRTVDVPSDIVLKGVAILISAGALPMLISVFLFCRADAKTTRPSPSRPIPSV